MFIIRHSFLLLALLCSFFFQSCQTAENKTPPNIILILADDMGLDAEIGRIIKKLEEENILQNTLIIFLSDNGATQAAIYLATGWHADRTGEIGTAVSFDSYGASWANVSNTPLQLFKHWTTEGGIATPFIAFWPDKIKPAVDRNHYGHIIDMLPTFLDVAGVPLRESVQERIPMEGESLLPLFNGSDFFQERVLFWEHQGNWAVRKGEWKLVFTREVNSQSVNRPELYNLRKDRPECRDLAANHPELVDEFSRMYEEWAERAGVEPWDSLILARIYEILLAFCDEIYLCFFTVLSHNISFHGM